MANGSQPDSDRVGGFSKVLMVEKVIFGGLRALAGGIAPRENAWPILAMAVQPTRHSAVIPVSWPRVRRELDGEIWISSELFHVAAYASPRFPLQYVREIKVSDHALDGTGAVVASSRLAADLA